MERHSSNEIQIIHNFINNYHYNRAMLQQQNNSYREWDICWDHLSSTGCKRKTCGWRHIEKELKVMEPRLSAEAVIINITNSDNVNNDIEIQCQLILWNIINDQTVSIHKLMEYTKFDEHAIKNALKHLWSLGFIEISAVADEYYKLCVEYLSMNLYDTRNPLMIELQRKFGNFDFDQFESVTFVDNSSKYELEFEFECVTETATAITENSSVKSVNEAFDLFDENDENDHEEINEINEIVDTLIKQEKIKKILY